MDAGAAAGPAAGSQQDADLEERQISMISDQLPNPFMNNNNNNNSASPRPLNIIEDEPNTEALIRPKVALSTKNNNT